MFYNIFMEDSQRLQIIIDNLKLTPNAFSKEIGLERPEIIYNVLKGKNGLSRKLASLITTKYTNISYAWLLSGEGSPFVENVLNEPMAEYSNELKDNSINDLLKQIKDKDRLIATLEELKDRYKLELEKLTKENEQLKEEIINLKTKG